MIKNKRTFFYNFKEELKSHPLSMFAVILLISIIAFAFIYSLTVDMDALYKINPRGRNMPPMTDGYLLGTDKGGKDIFKLLVVGVRNSIMIALSVTTLSSLIGINLGVMAGYFGGKVDNITMRAVDFISLLPSFIFQIILIITIKNYTPAKFVLILVLFNWIGYVRMIRASTLGEGQKEYIMASKVLGTPNYKIIYKQLIPNLVPLISLRIILGLASSLTIETGLTYLGFGLPANTPSIGQLISSSREISTMQNYPWLWMPAVFVLLVMMLCINATGQTVNRALMAKQKA